MDKIGCIIILFFTTVFYSQESELNEDLMYTYFDKGLSQMYMQKDSAYALFDKASDIASDLKDYDSFLGVLDHVVITANYHDDISKYQLTLKRMDSLLTNESVRPQITDLTYWKTAYLGKLALYYSNTKEYNKSKNIFLNIISDWKGQPAEKLDDTKAEMLYKINGLLGTIYRHQEKYELAEQYFLSNISLVETHELFAQLKDSYRNGVQQRLAQLYTAMGKHDEAKTYFEQNLKWSKEFYAKDVRYKYNVINAYQKITESFVAQDSLQKALYTLDESRPYLIDDPFLNEVLVLYGDIYAGLENFEEARINYQKAMDFILEKSPNQIHQDIAEVHGKIAALHLKQKNYQEGLNTIQKAFNVSGNNIKISDFKENPRPREVFSKIQLLQLLDIKLQLLNGLYMQTAEAKYQTAGQQTSHDILETFDELKAEFDSKLDKQFLAKKAYPIFHRMMEIAHSTYEKNRSTETLQLALNIAEKNKDFVLLEALRNAQATQYGGVPKNILEKEAQLRTEITNLEKQLFDATESENGYSDALFKQKQTYYDFLDTLKTQYPKYHELKYQNKTLDLATLREKVLEDSGTMISYTMTGDHLYAIVVNDAKEDFIKLPFDKADRQSIEKFYQLLSSPSIKQGEHAISEISNRLYDKILKAPLANFDTENLTIIPDGELHYLPFDLLQENGTYLLQTKNIGYGNSVTSLLSLKEKENSQTDKILALAPSFSGTASENADRQFGKLLYNDDEVQKIGGFFESETLFKKEATLANFMSRASEFNMFHLATHASANDKFPDYSYLAFTEDTDKGNILYIKDLYNMSLNADMVTLSACQTGIGKLQKGQGMLSLSKGFYYAGAKSLVNTLWKINDKSTVKLMEYFYQGLSEGNTKPEALRKAKLKYLETTDDDLLKHPYYWAAFVVSGDTTPIAANQDHWWIIVAGIFLLILIGLLSKNRKNFKKVQLYK